MGVARCTASRMPSMEFPDITKARREPACGARKTAPVWGEEKVQLPVEQRKTSHTYKNKRGSLREPIPVTHDNFFKSIFKLRATPRCEFIFKSHSHSREASVFHSFRSPN